MANRKKYCLNLNRAGSKVLVSNAITNEQIAWVTFGHRHENPKVPDYIYMECINILNATQFELNRGYRFSGEPCQLNDRRL